MNDQTRDGAIQKAKGVLKETAGKVSGDRRMQAEGMADKVLGSAKEALGKAKDAINKATD